jgi:hypothetical protein
VTPYRLWPGLAVVLAGCAPEFVQLQPDRVAPPPPSAAQPFEVILSVAGGADPLPVRGDLIVYGGVADATRRFVAAAVAPWAARHQQARPGGWQLQVELVRSDAEAGGGLITVEIETRVTLRGTIGQVHLGQTRGYCKVSLAPTGDGSGVVYSCLERMSRDLAGWLEGQSP